MNCTRRDLISEGRRRFQTNGGAIEDSDTATLAASGYGDPAMSIREPLLVCGLLLLSGCQTPPLQSIEQSVGAIVSHPFDVAPMPSPKSDAAPLMGTAAPSVTTSEEGKHPEPPPEGTSSPFNPNPATAPIPTETPPRPQAAEPGAATSSQDRPASPAPAGKVILTSFTEVDRAPPVEESSPLHKFELLIPKEIPGSETPLVKLPEQRTERGGAVARFFPKLPPLPEEPTPLPGPNGRPYSLADLQRLAAANSPTLRQAAADVATARGQLIQAGLYPNPTIGYEAGPNANNTATGTQGFFVDQIVKTGGKLKIQSAAQQMNYRNAELALGALRPRHHDPRRLLQSPRRQGNGSRQQSPRQFHRRDLSAPSRPAGRRLHRQPRAGGAAVAGVPRASLV